MRASHGILTRTVTLAVVLVAAGGLLGVPAASAAPRTPRFGPLIERFMPYEGQSRCSPKEKPGVTVFKRLLLRTYGSTWISTSRDCDVGGKSEHKEGRALDWAMDASKAADRAKVNDLFEWMFATDRFGKRQAIARRLGMMYIIWNRKWWRSWDPEWTTYCTQTKQGCKTASGSYAHPHTDHVHFSFSWPGARKRTSFFHPDRSFIAGMAAEPDGSGYWLAGGDGSVRAYNASFHGSKGGKFLVSSIVGMAAHPRGNGYWLAMRSGRVLRFGDAALHGRVQRRNAKIVGIAPHPGGSGYWLVGKAGAVAAFGDARKHGRVEAGTATVVGMFPTASGRGYWVIGADGEVFAFGDARHRGDRVGKPLAGPVVGGARSGTDGYWLVSRGGRVYAFGSARLHGQPRSVDGMRPVAAIMGTPSGEGYWVVGRTGKVAAFGDATFYGSLRRSG